MGRNIERDVIDAITALGFTVYAPTEGLKTYLFYTDGKNIGYMQRGEWGGLSLSTVNIPCRECGTGFRMTEGKDPPIALTRQGLAPGFAHAPEWASATDRQAVRKWPSVEAFLGRNTIPMTKYEQESK